MMDTNKDLYNFFKDYLETNGYEFYDKGSYNLNIIGVRTSEDFVNNTFSDTMYVVYKDSKDNHVVKSYVITTFAGVHYFKYPMNPAGTAILKPGQYLSHYKIGLHRGKYKALVQAKPITVYRDNNKDDKYDYVNVQEGMFGINIHKSKASAEHVHKWSAGCQVFKYAADFKEFMYTVSVAAKIWGNSFTYTLIE
jgi:hypothetical protein